MDTHRPTQTSEQDTAPKKTTQAGQPTGAASTRTSVQLEWFEGLDKHDRFWRPTAAAARMFKAIHNRLPARSRSALRRADATNRQNCAAFWTCLQPALTVHANLCDKLGIPNHHPGRDPQRLEQALSMGAGLLEHTGIPSNGRDPRDGGYSVERILSLGEYLQRVNFNGPNQRPVVAHRRVEALFTESHLPTLIETLEHNTRIAQSKVGNLALDFGITVADLSQFRTDPQGVRRRWRRGYHLWAGGEGTLMSGSATG